MPVDNNIEDIIMKMQELSLKNIFQKEAWKIFFEGDEMRSVMVNPRFLRALGDSVYLKHIGADLHDYLNEQLDIIAGYLKDYGVDYEGSEETAALDYARSKVKSAYQPKQKNDDSNAKRILGIILAIVGICFSIFSRHMITLDNQKRAQEQRERMEQYKEFEQTITEQHNIIEEQNNQWMRDILEQDPETAQGVKQHLDELLESGSISQQVYDELIKDYGLDQTESGEETAEE